MSPSGATAHTRARNPGSALQDRVTAAITGAFFEELAKVGYGRMSVDAIVRRAGVGKAAVRTQVRESREAHAERAALAHELASYNSQADLDDLHAILDRYSDTETREIRRILAAQRSRSTAG